ncbi:hypothetical protein FHX82_002938 [Amycolatopsis bartoniae]|uniref:Uncharacterized protein n=1 Tax=Amycolatopsis bartoniae TaxID=941986 RepID=A0A8H9MCF8_9PSEU|nr:hypothetical protein [Amycolatopsis bartoniae]MBB2935884.1 hypothetical protein [Amycolatopsis bartoniae]TVT02661.1 hypothetical protein FNH07_26760 [Amycolatopsis bartoniae]GHF62561.1 hypothetical protein GCM10017566_40120 [Amycolatopsis bartoniae]
MAAIKHVRSSPPGARVAGWAAAGTGENHAIENLLQQAAVLGLRAPELTVVFGERAASLAEAGGSDELWVRAESLVVSARVRLGLRAGIVGRAVAALRAAEDLGEVALAAGLRTDLAICARSVGVPLTGLAALRPALGMADFAGAGKAAALCQLVGCLSQFGRKPELDRTLAEADRLCGSDDDLDGDDRLLARALVRVAMSAHRRRHGDVMGAADAARTGLGLLEQLDDPDCDGGVVRVRLVLHLVCSLLDRGDTEVATELAESTLTEPERAASIAPLGWLRMAIATRILLPAGSVEAAAVTLRDAVHSTERHGLHALTSRLWAELAHVEERLGRTPDAIECLHHSRAAEHLHMRARRQAMGLLSGEFGNGGHATLDLDEVLGADAKSAEGMTAHEAVEVSPAAETKRAGSGRNGHVVVHPAAESGRRRAEQPSAPGRPVQPEPDAAEHTMIIPRVVVPEDRNANDETRQWLPPRRGAGQRSDETPGKRRAEEPQRSTGAESAGGRRRADERLVGTEAESVQRSAEELGLGQENRRSVSAEDSRPGRDEGFAASAEEPGLGRATRHAGRAEEEEPGLGRARRASRAEELGLGQGTRRADRVEETGPGQKARRAASTEGTGLGRGARQADAAEEADLGRAPRRADRAVESDLGQGVRRADRVVESDLGQGVRRADRVVESDLGQGVRRADWVEESELGRGARRAGLAEEPASGPENWQGASETSGSGPKVRGAGSLGEPESGRSANSAEAGAADDQPTAAKPEIRLAPVPVDEPAVADLPLAPPPADEPAPRVSLAFERKAESASSADEALDEQPKVTTRHDSEHGSVAARSVLDRLGISAGSGGGRRRAADESRETAGGVAATRETESRRGGEAEPEEVSAGAVSDGGEQAGLDGSAAAGRHGGVGSARAEGARHGSSAQAGLGSAPKQQDGDSFAEAGAGRRDSEAVGTGPDFKDAEPFSEADFGLQDGDAERESTHQGEASELSAVGSPLRGGAAEPDSPSELDSSRHRESDESSAGESGAAAEREDRPLVVNDPWLPRLRLPPSLEPFEDFSGEPASSTSETHFTSTPAFEDEGLGEPFRSEYNGSSPLDDDLPPDAGLADLLARALAEHQAGTSSAAALVKRLGNQGSDERRPVNGHSRNGERPNGRHRGGDR